MGIIARVKEWVMNYIAKAKEEFKIKPVDSDDMDSFVTQCLNIYQGRPYWLNKKDHIDTINFASAVCRETARLVTLNGAITVSGSPRAEWLQKQIDEIFPQIRHWVEYGCAVGTIILKPNVDSVECMTPDRFTVTDSRNGDIRGVVFCDQERSQDGNRWYTRLEYHRFMDDGIYVISNRCFVGYSEHDISRPIDISLTPWRDLMEDAFIENLDRPLFGVFRTPQANNIDLDSPLGLPIFSDAIRELKDLDIAYSRNVKEIFDSKRTVLLDTDLMLPLGENTIVTAFTAERQREAMGLPDMVRNVHGTGTESYYQEINPMLNTDTRLMGINALLNQIGYKCGFSNGYFVFSEKTGLTTATQVEADQQRTIQFIADVRGKFNAAISGLVYALDAFADLYNLAPVGTYEMVCHFQDITYSFEEDRLHHYNLAMQGKFPWEEYYVQYLKCSREEAKALLSMAKQEQKVPTLFGMEE